MKQKNLNIFSMSISLFLISLMIAAGIYAINQRTDRLKDEEFTQSVREMQHELQTLITEKKDAMLLIAHTLAQDATLHKALIDKNASSLNMTPFVDKLIQDTSLSHIQFHIVDADARSFYRSWTQKKGDSLKEVRIDVMQMLQEQKASSLISVGIYDITFKAMVPIFYEEKLIGIVEAISKTGSIVSKMKQRGFGTVVLVDKHYKKQLFYPFTKHFIDDYYVATPNVDPLYLEYINTHSLATLIAHKGYKIDTDLNLISTSIEIQDIIHKPMAYFLLFTPYDSIDLTGIIQDRNLLSLVFILFFLVISGLFLYFYVKRHNALIQKMNKRLEEKVEEKTASLHYLAHHDTLTSLPNRLLFIDRLKQSILHAKHQKKPLHVLFLDLDRFKEINDSFGHDIGDKLLITVSQRLKDAIREEDTVARLGGDEFTILLADMDQNHVTAVLKKILISMREPVEIGQKLMYTTFSIGISRFPEDGDSPDILIRNADTAMYRAKDLGKNRYQFYDEQMTRNTMQRLDLENKLRHAIQNNHLHPYFQAQVDGSTEMVIGAEALVRWCDPELGVISPVEFIPLAEEIGLIAMIDESMMLQSFHIIQKLQKQDLFHGQLSLNLSVKQLEKQGFLEKLKALLEETNFDPTHLKLEVIESQIMKDPQAAIEILLQVQKMGISIAIDDFGTGYSSLSYLKRLPINQLKIDRSFIIDLPDDAEDVAIVKAIIALARSLNINIIAEGVETQEQKSFLLQEGCHHIQGYLYSKPLDAQAFEEYLKEKKL